jgi:enterochelin esterase-like enzyme
VKSEVLKAERNYTVYLPAGYDQQTERTYPVLYLLHGMNDTNKGWYERGHVKDVIDQLTASGEACEMIIVTPDAGGNIMEDKWNGYFNMEGWNYEDFFFNEFVPMIESKYRIKADKAHRAVAGLSMGGGGATSYAQRHADMFAACYAMSALMHLPPASAEQVATGNKMALLTDAANRYSCVDYVKGADEARKQQLRSVQWFIDCGDDDFLFDCNLDLYQEMRKARIACQLRVRDGGHTWEYWHSALYTALPYFSRIFGK